jgi:RNA recognition motif-containing protein
MSINLFVGNVAWETTEAQLRNFFEQFGEVDSVKLISDRETGKPRGFGFVSMAHQDDANMAIKEGHGAEFGGRLLNINEARPREEKPRGAPKQNWDRGKDSRRDNGRDSQHDRGREARGNRDHRY